MGRQRRDEPNESGIDEIVVRIYRCVTVVRGGRRFSFSALVSVDALAGAVSWLATNTIFQQYCAIGVYGGFCDGGAAT